MEVLHIQPIAISKLKVTLFSLLMLALIFGTLMIALFYCIQIFIFGASMILMMFRHHQKLRVKMFYRTVQWQQDNIDHFAVYSIYSRQDQRHLVPRVCIVTTVARHNRQYIFRYNQTLYTTKESQAEKLQPNQVLSLLGITDIEQILTQGLNDQQIKRSNDIFGVQQDLATPSVWRLFLRSLDFQVSWIMVNLNSLFFTKLISSLFWFIMLGMNIVAFLMILITAFRDAKMFRNKNVWIKERTFHVLRGGLELEIPVIELVVGDVVYPKVEGDFVFWFSAMLAGKMELVIRNGQDEQIKAPLRSAEDLAKQNWDRYFIPSFSKVDKAQLMENERFIVTQHNSISKNFSRWFSKPLTPAYTPPSELMAESGINFFYLAFVVQIFLFLLLSLTQQISIIKATQPFYIGSLHYYLIQAPILFILYEISYFSVKLYLKDIEIYSFTILESGYIQNVVINFRKLLELQYEELLYKNKLLGFQTQAFQPNAETVKNGNTYESLLVMILYVSLGEFQQEWTMLKGVYQTHREHFQYVDGLNDFQDVTHVDTGKKWEVLRVIQENQQGRRSWLVQYEGKATYVITQVPSTGDPFKLLGDKEDRKKRETYELTNKELQQEGKLVKIMLFRNLKEERLRSSAQQIVDYSDWPRQKLQCKYQFGTFMVFDYALDQETVDGVSQLKAYGKGELSLSFISSQSKSELAGFEHILTNIPFVYNCSDVEMAEFANEKTNEKSCVYIGGAMEDHSAFQMVDVSVQLRAQKQQLLLPADICINSMRQLLMVLKVGRWLQDLFNEMMRLTIVFTLFAVLGGIFLDRTVNSFFIKNQFEWSLVASGLFIFLPVISRLVGMRWSLQEYIPRSTTFFSQSLVTGMIVNLIFSILLVYCAELIGLCHVQPGIFLRNKKHQPPKTCIDLFLLLSTTSVMIHFVIFSGNNWRAEKQIWPRLLLVPIWLAVLYFDKIPLTLIGYSFGGFVVILLVKLVVGKFCS